ncbi:MAG: FecR domain-containing protein [Myxococcaceae bacterium]|nr:FecR domain-containing protein [Myxococcaceae bacterium]
MSSADGNHRPGRARSNLIFFGLLVLILLALPVGWYFFLRRPPAPPPEPPRPEAQAPVAEVPRPVDIHLAEIEGTVEIRRADGTWREAAKGDPLKASDAVRTRDGSVAVLVGGEAWEVRMEPGTEVSVDELTSSITKIMLQNGMARAKVNGAAKHTFEVRAAGSDAVATTTRGVFAISNNGAGTVAVGTQEGEVQLSGAGKVVIVRSGQQSIVRPGVGPSEPTPIPSSLLLKVKWPQKPLLGTNRLVVTGETAPGAHVEIGGHVVRANADGRFQHTLRLQEGGNDVTVTARSVGGTEAASQTHLQVDTHAPKMGVNVDWK